tara:strand:- start:24 stop:452 length:429 start_codon:yes stop_codon:yes gene_type:complete
MGFADNLLKAIMKPVVKRAFQSINKNGEIDKLSASMKFHQDSIDRRIVELLSSDDIGLRMVGKKLHDDLLDSVSPDFKTEDIPNFEAIPKSPKQAKDWLSKVKEELDLELISQEDYDKVKEELKPYVIFKSKNYDENGESKL